MIDYKGGKSIEMKKKKRNEQKKLWKYQVSRWNEFCLVAFLMPTGMGVPNHKLSKGGRKLKKGKTLHH